jgi:hypothetical protein
MLFAIADVRQDVREILVWLKGVDEDGEGTEDDA